MIPFRFAKHNMSSKIVGWLVGARDGKILEFKIKLREEKNSGIFQEFPGFSKIQESVL